MWDKRYSEGVNGGVVRYAVQPASAAKLLRMGFEHRQSTKDTATFWLNNPHVSQMRRGAHFVAMPALFLYVSQLVLQLCTGLHLEFICRLK